MSAVAKGEQIKLRRLRYGSDNVQRRFALYVGSHTEIEVLGEKRKEATVTRRSELLVSREVVASYLVQEFDGLDPMSADRMVKAYDPEGEKRLLNALDSGDAPAIAAQTEVGQTLCRAIVALWCQQPATHRAQIAVRSLGLNKWQARNALERAMAGLDGDLERKYLRAAHRICQHPYRLNMIDGIGFDVAEKAASALDLPSQSAHRCAAAARQVLSDAAREGDTYLPLYLLAERSAKLLAGGPRPADVVSATDVASTIWAQGESDGISFPFGRTDMHSPVSTQSVSESERFISQRCVQMLSEGSSEDLNLEGLTDEQLSTFAERTLHPSQAAACRTALGGRLAVITGGPGTGKTTILKAVLGALESRGLSILQAAPTGMAAERMERATGCKSDTVHRALGSRGLREGFKHDAGNPLSFDVVVVDETSMNDVAMMHAIVAALKPGARLIMVGDQDQLPSIGAGAVLADLISSGVVPVARLTKTYRQKGENPILELAWNIRDGIPALPAPDGEHFSLSNLRDSKEIVRDVVAKVLALRDMGVDPAEVCVLAPMNVGPVGTAALNARIQSVLNPEASRNGLRIGNSRRSQPDQVMVAAPGDRVMQLVNDRTLELANGEVGTVRRLGRSRRSLIVDFGMGETEIYGAKLNNLQLAYASTVHKSQGSEYRHVILAVAPSHSKMLRRNLLYTACTRAKHHLHLSGDPDAVIRGIHQLQDSQRRTLLQAFLREEASKVPGFVPYEDRIARGEEPRFDLDDLVSRLNRAYPEMSPS